MKKKYLKPGCILREVRGMQLLEGSLKIDGGTTVEGDNGGWAKESDNEGNSDNSFSVWED